MHGLLFLLFIFNIFVLSLSQSICNHRIIKDNANNFFEACETGKGWNVTKKYVSSELSPFNSEVTDSLPGPPLSKVNTIKDYSEWMVGVIEEFGPKATVEIKANGIDEERNIIMYYAIFGGVSDYVYSLQFNINTCMIDSMHKIWNDGYASKHPPENIIY